MMPWLVAAALAAEVSAPAPAASLEGRVVDAETGAPVAAVLEAGDVRSAADAGGAFRLAAAPGTPVTVRAEGYVELVVAAPAGGDWRIRLAPADVPLEVVVEARRDAPVVSVQTLDRERVEETAGTFGDAVRLVQSLPGVAVTQEFSPRAGSL
ncbi:MAG: hypothetical protein RLZZ299_2816, partial [Pseudomonadota bacterium]